MPVLYIMQAKTYSFTNEFYDWHYLYLRYFLKLILFLCSKYANFAHTDY
jgi:hypothetical protein